MIGLLIVSVSHYGVVFSLKKYLQQKHLLVLAMFFFIVLVSGIYSEDKTEWIKWLRIKLPYLALPLAFAPIQKLASRKFIILLYALSAILCISALVVLCHYVLNYQRITESFLRGCAIPMPFSHIRYTLMLSFSFFALMYLFYKKQFLFHRNEKYIQAAAGIFLFITLHILSVRSSLVAVYLVLFIALLWLIFSKKNFTRGLLLLSLLGLIAFASVKLIPSLRNKAAYMNYDFGQFKKGEISHLSDGVRFISMQGAFTIGKQNVWAGVGAGDIKNAMNDFYRSQFPQLPLSDYKLPHNQLLWVFASTGAIGLILFLFAFFYPLVVTGIYKNPLLLAFCLIIFSSFFTEATLEEQMGTGFYLIVLLILLNQFRDE